MVALPNLAIPMVGHPGGAMQDYQKLDAWKKSHELALETYRATAMMSDRQFPSLPSQMRRSAFSVPANIVEGCAHRSQPEFARFLQLAAASALELSYHLLLARDLGALPDVGYAKLDARVWQVRQMIGGLLRKVRADLSVAERPKRACNTPRAS
jgi:four helix bundle protein